MLLFGLANVLYPADEANRLFTAMFGAIIFAFVLVGALLSVRVPSNVIGPMLLGSGAMLAVTVAVGTFAIVSATREDLPAPILAAALLVNDIGFVVPIIVVLIGVPLVFPDGRLLSPRWRWIVVLTAVALTGQISLKSLDPALWAPRRSPTRLRFPPWSRSLRHSTR